MHADAETMERLRERAVPRDEAAWDDMRSQVANSREQAFLMACEVDGAGRVVRFPPRDDTEGGETASPVLSHRTT